MDMKPGVYRVRVRRENDDADVVFLCSRCLGSVGDFLRILSKSKARSSDCDRCGTACQDGARI